MFGDKGFIGTDYITTPVRKPESRELYIREMEYNEQAVPIGHRSSGRWPN